VGLYLPRRRTRRYEWVSDPAFGYREWLVQAALINEQGRVRLIDRVNATHARLLETLARMDRRAFGPSSDENTDGHDY